MRNLRKIVFGLLAFLSVNFFCKELTGDFSMIHLIQPFPQDPLKEMDTNTEKPFLHQKYTYLGKGNQAFVFVSEDGNYVLKLIRPLFPSFYWNFLGKSHRVRPVKLPFAKTLMKKIYAEEFAEQKERDLQSFVNAFAFFKEEMQLEYVHVSKTDHLQCELKVYDKIGVLHSIDLDNTCFLVQKKTAMLYPTLSSLIDQREEGKSKELISSFVNFCFNLVNKGMNNPTTIERNLGCVGLSPVQIDVGRVFIENHDSATKIEQFVQSTRHMKKWLTHKDPNLELYLQSCIEEVLKEKT